MIVHRNHPIFSNYAHIFWTPKSFLELINSQSDFFTGRYFNFSAFRLKKKEEKTKKKKEPPNGTQ